VYFKIVSIRELTLLIFMHNKSLKLGKIFVALFNQEHLTIFFVSCRQKRARLPNKVLAILENCNSVFIFFLTHYFFLFYSWLRHRTFFSKNAFFFSINSFLYKTTQLSLWRTVVTILNHFVYIQKLSFTRLVLGINSHWLFFFKRSDQILPFHWYIMFSVKYEVTCLRNM
jgi:hypothetical protein